MSGNPPLKIRDARAPLGFTLVELLVVISLMLLVMTFVVPALNGIKGSGDVTKAVYDVSGALDQARAYAIANNTYVYVGIGEFDGSSSTSSYPQPSGVGRLAIATVASRDGTRGYDTEPLSNIASSWATKYNSGANLTAVGKLVVLDNIHMAATTTGTVGGLNRPAVLTTGSFTLGDNNSKSATPIQWPLGKPLTVGEANPNGQYYFEKVINFDPQGIARIQFPNSSADDIGSYMEIDLQQTHGSVISSGSNVVVIQVDCMTGANHIYRP